MTVISITFSRKSFFVFLKKVSLFTENEGYIEKQQSNKALIVLHWINGRTRRFYCSNNSTNYDRDRNNKNTFSLLEHFTNFASSQ